MRQRYVKAAWAWTAVAAATTAVAVSACGVAPSSGEAPSTRATSPAAIVAASPARTTLTTFASPSVSASSSDSPTQTAILSDGTVTFGEYEQAVLSTVACIEVAGVNVQGPYRQSDSAEYGGFAFIPGVDLTKLYVWNIVAPTSEMLDAAEKIDSECRSEFFSDVEVAWTKAIQPSETEVAQWWRDLARCLESRGYSIAPSATRDDLSQVALGNTVVECYSP